MLAGRKQPEYNILLLYMKRRYIMSWKYILFDLDGTITDSSEGILNCIEYAFVSMGRTVPGREELFKFIGPPLVNGFQEITGFSYEEAVEAVAKYRERYSVTGLFENIPYNGIAEMLKKLKENGKIIAIATSKPENYAIRILEHFNLAGYFNEITGSTLDGSRNNKRAVIEECFLRLGLSSCDKSNIIMIGDRKHDIIAAKQCGIASAGVYYGFAGKGELEEAGADYIVDTVQEVAALLLS